jgi:hypothetical protein
MKEENQQRQAALNVCPHPGGSNPVSVLFHFIFGIKALQT